MRVPPCTRGLPVGVYNAMVWVGWLQLFRAERVPTSTDPSETTSERVSGTMRECHTHRLKGVQGYRIPYHLIPTPPAQRCPNGPFR